MVPFGRRSHVKENRSKAFARRLAETEIQEQLDGEPFVLETPQTSSWSVLASANRAVDRSVANGRLGDAMVHASVLRSALPARF